MTFDIDGEVYVASVLGDRVQKEVGHRRWSREEQGLRTGVPVRQKVQEVQDADAATAGVAGTRATPVAEERQQIDDPDLPVTVGAVPGAGRPEDNVALHPGRLQEATELGT